MNPHSIARRLINLASRVEPIKIRGDTSPYTQSEMEGLFDEFGVEQRIVRPAKQLVEELDGALADAGWHPDARTPVNFDDEHWTFGTIMLKGRQRDIYRGFIDPVKSIPILNRMPRRVVLYLITIKDGEDYLKREAHSGVGWHYHYLDWDKRRSNVILCWDTRWKAPDLQSEAAELRGLFVEKHAEGGKPFTAHPGAWGTRKRESMYAACKVDLLSRDIKEYRCAANKSEPVYPLNARLTPHPSSVTPAKVKGGEKSRKFRH